jgi:hypothetical protein
MKYFFTTRLGETRFLQADGSLLCKDVPIARTGTQIYLPEEIDLEADSSGTVTVHRMEDEVFSPETMASFEGAAVTLGHPEDSEGNIRFVNPGNYAELAHGHIQNVRRGSGEQSNLLLADVLVKRQEAIDAINAGLTDVSCGYDALYKQLAPGKGKQYQITGNHLAVGIEKGRAGSRCAIGDSAPTLPKRKEKPAMSWLKKLATAIKTKDEDALQKLIDEAPDMPSDGLPAVPGVTINMNQPAQATALPAEQKTTVDDDPNKKTGDNEEDMPEWAKALVARLDKLEGKTADADSNPDDAEEDAKVTADAAFRRNIISDAEIIAPGFKPTGDKGIKRQVLQHALKKGDSLSAFGVPDFTKTPKATVDAIFRAAVEVNKAKNQLKPGPIKTGDSSRRPTPADLNKQFRDHWKRN